MLLEGIQESQAALSNEVASMRTEEKGQSAAIKRAAEASHLAQQAVASEDLKEESKWSTAIIYAVNAVTNDSCKYEYYAQLNDIIRQMPQGDEKRLTLQQISGILEMGMYKVDPKHIADLSRLIQEQHDLMNEYDKQQFAEAAASRSPLDFDRRWKEIADAEEIDTQLKLCRELTDELHGRVSEGEDFGEQIAHLNTATEYLECMQEIHRKLSCVDAKLQGGDAEKNMPVMEALLQNVNGELMQAWNYDSKSLPRNQEADLTKATEKLLDQQERLQRVRSEADIRLIEAILTDAPTEDERMTLIDSQFPIDGEEIVKSRQNAAGATMSVYIAHGDHTKNIMRLSRKVAKLNLLMDGVYAPEKMPEWKEAVNKLNAEINREQQARTIAYQKYAVVQCREAMKRYEMTTFFGEKDAEKVITSCLTSIETSLLLPETVDVYQSVLRNCLFDKLSSKKRFKMEVLLATSSKKSLIEF